MTLPKPVLAIIGLILLAGLAIGGYFLSIAISKAHEENMSNLAGFGSIVTPGGESVDNSNVLAPTLGEPKISTTDKIIISLTAEKNTLVAELDDALAQIKILEDEVALLNNYRETNERYAPRLMTEEREFAVKTLTGYLDSAPEAEQFDDFQRKVMIEQTANKYVDIVRRFSLQVSEEDRRKLMEEYLPAYAFCIGKDIGLVANTRLEQVKLLLYFKNKDSSTLSSEVYEDVQTIEAPCLSRLNDQVHPLFRTDLL